MEQKPSPYLILLNPQIKQGQQLLVITKIFLTLKNSKNSLINSILKLIFHSTFYFFFFKPVRIRFIEF